ncbi:hypothetical protein GE107_06090 [Cohnella sp. CFH 77786]|uniref:O-antigen ligase family protein n=1 Tax=Cohnella sp. CFH 77786 TaxID=2662265 RepID=UPI001C60CAC5|nr:O-antigen ligase family protein [Cohnella sp. CFH 77786]MBW5445633.1 hypothetical protein [Cohnella sp. CFH 77786]
MSNGFMYIFLSFYFWIGALWQGYFADMAYLTSNLVLFAGLLVLIGRKRELVFSRIHLFVFLIIGGYWVSVFYSVDVEQAVLEASRVSGLIPLVLLIGMLPDDRLQRLYRSWPWIGAALTVAGILLDMERNGRLESTIEYANALAIFLLVNIGICLVSYLQERRAALMGLMAVNAVGLLLTFSRSVWVLWLAMMIAAVIWFPELRKRAAWLPVGIVHVCSLILALLLKGDAFFFWQRVSSIQSKTSEFQIRLVYWKDSLDMIRDYWLGGTGGGGWNVLVPLYRSQDYFVRYVHNHYVQIALDIGIFGLLSFVAWIGVICWLGVKRLRQAKNEARLWGKGSLFLVMVIILHAGFDFDLTFPFLFAILACLAVQMDVKRFRLRVTKGAFVFALPATVAVIGFWGWLAVGYGYKQAADFQANTGRYAKAQKMYQAAEYMLPWSSNALYGSAKGYVLQGNATGDGSYYQMAREKLKMAHNKVPEQTLYTDLLKQLPVNSTKID